MARPQGARNLHTKYDDKRTKLKNVFRGISKQYQRMREFERRLDREMRMSKCG